MFFAVHRVIMCMNALSASVFTLLGDGITYRRWAICGRLDAVRYNL
jgi:hypothetical protein